MAEPTYTVFIRVPMPRGGFVDPPPVNWDSNKDEALWKILSGAAKREIDWNEVADRFEVTVDFLLQQVAFLTERHASQVRAQVRKATAAARGSAAPSPIPGSDSAGLGHQRAPSALSIRRDSPMPRNEHGSGSGTPLNSSTRPVVSRINSTNTTVLRDMMGGSASPRPGMVLSNRATDHRRRLSSLPITSKTTTKSPEREPQKAPSPAPERSPSPGPAEDSSTATSDDESSPAQSRIIRRPPRFQQNDAAPPYEDDDDDESEPAFQPYKASDQPSASDLGSTLKGDGRSSSKKLPKSLGKTTIHKSQTSDSSASSAAMVQRPGKSREQRQPGPLSPRRAELTAQSPGSKSRGYSREGSDGTPSMGSSFSDLDGMDIRNSPDGYIAMFRRNWSGLPKDVSFPTNLAGLGYFINDEDEIRLIDNPDYYFKFFISKNMRVNERQRFAFNGAMEAIVHERLEKEDLKKMTLPLEATRHQNHTPIFTSSNLASCSRVVVVFGEPTQDLGILAGRTANGSGGLANGTMISVVRALHQQVASPDDQSPPGIVLANMGQRYWWPEGKRALTMTASGDTPLPSLVHSGKRHIPSLNDIPGSETPLRHMTTLFTDVLGKIPPSMAKIDVIAIGESCEVVENFFEDQNHWSVWGNRLNSMLLLGTVFETGKLSNTEFKEFLAQRARGYIISEEPLDTPLAPPSGNPSLSIEPLGCPCYSSAEPHHIELIAIRALRPALRYLQEVAMAPDFVNPPISVIERPQTEFTDEHWEKLPDEERPSIISVDPEIMKKELKQAKRWRRFEQTGEAPDWDSDSSSDESVKQGAPGGGKEQGDEVSTW
ncbi:hypothetical protein AK830_g11188 [Neonectria ditissima]|uniref:Autophagy-related protein 29 n=1 Tax=Neonectria ditissima TaxID=78410 RepID=A0A0P7ARR0_9HYPO|nr:hypothetical protein AK830_g11188 [Neonectria ditissima]